MGETMTLSNPSRSDDPTARVGLPAGWLMLLVGWLAAGGVAASPWAEVPDPTPGPARVIGTVSNGCIAGAETLPESGPGYVSIRRYRNRYYGHPDLLRFIGDMGQTQSRRGDRLMMVGDLSQPRGGRMASSHRSHQNGLDVDIWFTLADSPAAARRLMDDRADPQSMVEPGGRAVSAAWGPAQQALIESAARHPDVDRIFVNAAIKQALCRASAPNDQGWLRKIRPWWGHDAHFHVRLRCPAGSPDCLAQDPLAGDAGCGSELAWWFSDEALTPKKGGGGSAEPSAPAACMALLQER
jgi:penicillin-insensitive murein endopeptidase